MIMYIGFSQYLIIEFYIRMSSASGISKDYSEPVEYHPTVSKFGNIFLKASNLLLRKASSISIYFVFSE